MYDLGAVLRAVRDAVGTLGKYFYAPEPQATMEEYLEGEGTPAKVTAEPSFQQSPASPIEPCAAELHVNLKGDAVAIDASSRIVRCAHANLVVASVALVSARRGLIADYPPRLLPRPLERAVREFAEPFLSLQPRVEMTEDGFSELEQKLDGMIRVKSLAGRYYDCNYNTFQIMDEARLALETRALELAIGRSQLVILDGPLTPLPKILFRNSYRGVAHYVAAYVEVAKARSELLAKADASGTDIIGVVKRTSSSHKLYHVHEVKGFFLARGKRIQKLSDDQTVSLMVSTLFREGALKTPAAVVIVGPFFMDLTELEQSVSDKLAAEGFSVSSVVIPSRELYYAWVPPHPYCQSGGYVLRLETTRGFYERKGLDGLLETLKFLLSTGMRWRKGIPTLLDLADSAARRTARAYFVLFARSVDPVSPLLYETRVELEEAAHGGAG